MPREPDPIWKHVQRGENGKWKCKFCSTESHGSATRIRAHLAGIPGYGIKVCMEVTDAVRTEALETFNGKGGGLDKSTGGTSRKGTEGTVFGASQSVLPSEGASNPNDTQNSNQHGCAPQQQSFYRPTGAGSAPASPPYRVSLPPSDMPLDNLDNTQQSDPSNHMSYAAHGNEIASPLQQPQIDWSALSSFNLSELLSPHLAFGGDVLPTSLPSDITTNSIPPNSNEQYPGIAQRFANEVILDSSVDSTENLHGSPPEYPPELPDVIANASEEIGLQEFTRELDMNEGAPMTSHPNTGNNFEENRALKRKLELLYSKEAIIRGELDFAASLSLKEPRMEVVNLLASVEKLKNDCLEAMSEDCLPSHQQVDILMNEAEDLMRPNRGLFEARGTKVGKLLEKKMVGEAFERNTSKILEYLVGNQVSRLGIYGMGGVGKTTIMVHIYNRLKDANYGNVLWITVSQDFNIKRLQDDIRKELGLGMLEENDVMKRAASLFICLMKKGKSTIILDDVWEHFDFNEVGIPVGEDGIKLVLTTRSLEVCHQMHCQEMIKIEPLSQIEAESLFLEELRSEVALNLEIEAIVKSIVRECAGLPLAIITMARSMHGVAEVFEWQDSLEKLRESDMGQTYMESKVLMKLKFSYNHLGNHEVQQCFLSCALYPEDELIGKLELIEFFIDQGLIGRLNTREKQYVRGLTILNKLANVCLLEVHGIMMKMHDLIRDMALHIMSATSIVKAGKGLKRIPFEEYWTDALEKVSLMKNDIEEFPLNMSPNCPKLSTFLFNRSSLHDVIIPNSFFKQLWGLKVLNLSGCEFRELPNSISDLVNLRALLLGDCCKLRRIPYLGKLRSLRKLQICQCKRVEALEGLEMLVNLRFLDLTYTCIKRLPKGTLGNLLNLQYLKVNVVSVEDITKLGALETLVCLFDNVDDFNKFVRVVSNQGNNPRYYKINVPKIGWDNVEQTNVGALFEYCERSVDIERSRHAIVSARGESSGSGSGICILIPQDVRKLRALNCDGATNLSNMGPLEELEDLEIKHWSNLRVLCGGQDEEVINIHDSPTQTSTPLLFRSLRDLEISDCPKLKYLFGHEPKFSLPHLRKIRIMYCREMVGITMTATSPPPYAPPAFPSLEEIKVESCGKMKRVVESEWLSHFPNLRRISVFYSENMEEIIRGLSSYISVEEISLERLLVEGCHELPIHLQNLQTIQVIDCEGMAEMISGVGQGQEGSMTTPINNTPSSSQSSISLPKPNYLCLYNLPQLKSMCEVPITRNSMEYVEVYGCPKLNRIPLELQFRDIKDLPHIVVEGKKKWKTLIWDHPDAQANLQSHLVFKGNCCILEGRRNSPAAADAAAAASVAAAIAANDAVAAATTAYDEAFDIDDAVDAMDAMDAAKAAAATAAAAAAANIATAKATSAAATGLKTMAALNSAAEARR